MKAIYKLKFDCGRCGSLDGIFTAEISEMNRLIQSGAEVYFGEVLGKHSEITGPIEQSNITLVTNDPEVVAVFEKHKMATGHNPFDYIELEDQP
jgi:hypothetical protein